MSNGSSDDSASSGSDASPRQSLLGDLIRRRVPQVVAGYLGVTWTLFELMKWLTNQYLISPYLGQAILFGLLLLLPSVVLVTYRHGRPGPDTWTHLERAGLAGNVVLAVVVLIAVFGGTELGSMVRPAQGTTRAGLSSDSGNTVASSEAHDTTPQAIPKKEFRRRVALFHFGEAAEADADTALRRVVPPALHADLDQDLFVSVFPPNRFDDELRERGYDSGLGVPLGLKQELAQRVNVQYILSGRVGHTEDEHVRLTTRLRETDTGDLVAERTFEGEALFALIDRASTQLKKDLGLPAAHLERVTDLPVTQVFTPSLPAAKHFAQGLHFDLFMDEAERKALAAYRRATEADSTFAAGYIGVGRSLWQLDRRDAAGRALRAAQRHSYRLPETRKYQLKALHLLRIKKQPQAALRVCERWTSLYPSDLTAWRLKGALHGELLQDEALVESYRHALALAPRSRKVRNSLIQGLLQTGQFEDALRRAESFASAHPRDEMAFVLKGRAHWNRGQLDEAQEALQRAEDLGSDRATYQLIALHLAKGHFNQAISLIDHQIQDGNGTGAKFQRWHYYWLRGQTDRSTVALDSLRSADAAQSNSPHPMVPSHACEYYDGLDKGPIEQGLKTLRRLDEAKENTPLWHTVEVKTGLAQCRMAMGELATAQRHLKAADSLAHDGLTPTRRVSMDLDYLWGRLREKQGNFRQAARHYEEFLQVWSGNFQSLTWNNRLPRLHLAVSYEELGQEEKAIHTYERALSLRPAYPRLNYHYARFLSGQGRREKARKHLRRALDAWAPADADFPLKQRAETLADSLGIPVT